MYRLVNSIAGTAAEHYRAQPARMKRRGCQHVDYRKQARVLNRETKTRQRAGQNQEPLRACLLPQLDCPERAEHGGG